MVNEFNKWSELIEISDKENTEWLTVAGSTLAPITVSGGTAIFGKALTTIPKGGIVSVSLGSVSLGSVWLSI